MPTKDNVASMTSILVDPWIVLFSETDRAANADRLAAIRDLLGISESNSVEFVRFLSPEQISEFYSMTHKLPFEYSDGELFEVMKHLEFLEEPLEIDPPRFGANSIPPANCDGCWCGILAACAAKENAPAWRNPMIVFPDARRTEWPKGHEIEFDIAEGRRVRNLVCIECCDEHPHFSTDLDPWRLNACGEPVVGARDCDERRPTWKRLPRPPSLLPSLTFEQLHSKLQDAVEPSNDDETRLYFVPCVGWNPNKYGRDEWRTCKVFDTQKVSVGPRAQKRGPIDRKDRIWIWDDEECHWDVQIDGGKDYWTVNWKGEVLKKSNEPSFKKDS